MTHPYLGLLLVCLCTLVSAQDNSMHMAVAAGDSLRVESLIDGGADVNGRMAAGFTPLMVGAKYGYTEVMETLITKGQASVNLANASGNTALMVAITMRRVASVKVLLLHNATATLKNKDGMDALELAQLVNSSVIQKLLQDYLEGSS